MIDRIRTFILSPWRAVPVLGFTQILTWGTLFYPPVLTVPLMAAERGWSITFAMGGFAGGLLTGGLIAPTIGRLIDRFGGNMVMACGSLAGALRIPSPILQHGWCWAPQWRHRSTTRRSRRWGGFSAPVRAVRSR